MALEALAQIREQAELEALQVEVEEARPFRSGANRRHRQEEDEECSRVRLRTEEKGEHRERVERHDCVRGAGRQEFPRRSPQRLSHRIASGLTQRREPEEVVDAARVAQGQAGHERRGQNGADDDAPEADQRPEREDRCEPEELGGKRREERLVDATKRVDARVVTADGQIEREPQQEAGHERVRHVERAVARSPDAPTDRAGERCGREEQRKREPAADRALDSVRLPGAMQVAHLSAQRFERSPPEARHECGRRRGDDHEPEVPPREVTEEEQHGDRMQRGLVQVTQEEVAKPVERVAPEPVAEEPLLEHDDAPLARGLAPKPPVERGLAHARARFGRRLRAATSEGSPHSRRSFRYGISRNARASRRPVNALTTIRAIQ